MGTIAKILLGLVAVKFSYDSGYNKGVEDSMEEYNNWQALEQQRQAQLYYQQQQQNK